MLEKEENQRNVYLNSRTANMFLHVARTTAQPVIRVVVLRLVLSVDHGLILQIEGQNDL